MGEIPVGTLTLPDNQHVVPEYWSAHGAAWQLQGCYDWTQQRVWDRHSSVLCSAAGSRVISQALTPGFCLPFFQEFSADFSRLGKPGKDTISFSPLQQFS